LKFSKKVVTNNGMTCCTYVYCFGGIIDVREPWDRDWLLLLGERLERTSNMRRKSRWISSETRTYDHCTFETLAKTVSSSSTHLFSLESTVILRQFTFFESGNTHHYRFGGTNLLLQPLRLRHPENSLQETAYEAEIWPV